MMESFFGGLLDPLYQSWNRPFREKDGYKVFQEPNNNGYLIVFNTLGLSEKDIKVTHKPEQTENCTRIKVCGTTTLPDVADEEYSANYEIIFRNRDDIDSVQYKVKDGLTIVYIKTKKKQKVVTPEEEIATNIADGESFNW